jgi:hypothetical protein
MQFKNEIQNILCGSCSFGNSQKQIEEAKNVGLMGANFHE